MLIVLAIGLGGGIGALARYYGGMFSEKIFGSTAIPIGTLVVNVIGCMLIGMLAGLSEGKPFWTTELRAFVFVGILGGFTTFSTFGFETFIFLRDGHFGAALLNIAAQVMLGLIAVYGGYALSRTM